MLVNIHSQPSPVVPLDNKVLWTVLDLARRTGVSERTIWGLTKPRGPIRCVKVGKRVLYAPADVQAWIDSLRRETTTTEGCNNVEG